MAKITHSGNEGAEVHFELRELSSHVMRLCEAFFAQQDHMQVYSRLS